MIIKTFYEEGNDDTDWRDHFTLIAKNDDGVSKRFSVGAGEPEDMFIFRDLSDVLSVPALMQLAYDAGVKGEKLEMVEVESEEEL